MSHILKKFNTDTTATQNWNDGNIKSCQKFTGIGNRSVNNYTVSIMQLKYLIYGSTACNVDLNSGIGFPYQWCYRPYKP